jgi:parvulin-like peptidyl-prolyl isomerase
MLKFRLLAPCAFFVVALVLSACGGGVPGNAVVKVDDQTIKRDTFDHWMKIAAISSAGQASQTGAAPTTQAPDAPDFTKCIAQKKATTKPAKGQPVPTNTQLKSQCQQEYDGLKSQVLQFLIRATWLDKEAASQGVKVTNADAQKSIDGLKKQQFPKEADYQKFLRSSGLTNADVLFQQRTTLLEQKITQKVTKGKDKVTQAQIADYYNKNKSRFATPERRNLELVLTKNQAQAAQAKKALQSGQSFAQVAKKFSIDTQTKNNGGKLQGVTKGQQEPALDQAVFTAPKNKLVGPVKTQFGWYVFDVTGSTPAKQQTLAQSTASIKQLLTSQGQQNALKKFGNDYRDHWKSLTECRKGFTTEDCKGQKNTPTQTAAPQQQQTPTTP